MTTTSTTPPPFPEAAPPDGTPAGTPVADTPTPRATILGGARPDTHRLRYMPGLDGVRGVAVLAVLLFHAGHLAGGFLGVDAFLALSGFLITSLLLSEFATNRSVGLGAFWARRVRRLIPGLLFMLAGVALYALLVAEAEELERIRQDALATLGYVANWNTLFQGDDYWALFAAPSPLEHAWTLAIEEQFYLIWPIAFAGLVMWWKLTSRALFGFCVTGAVAASAWMWFLYTPGGPTQRVYVGTDTRATALLGGAALACWIAWRGETTSRIGRSVLEVLAIISVGGLAWAWIAASGQSAMLYRGGFLLHAVPVVIVIAAAAHSRAGPVGRMLSWRPLVWLGLISYGLYLWHWPVYVFLSPTRTGLEGWSLTAVRIAVSLAIAVFSYHAIEMPVRRGALRGWRIQALLPAAVVAIAVLLVATTTGAVSRPTFDETVAAAAADAEDLTPPSPPVAETADRPPRILVVGDSLGYFLGQDMAARGDELGVVAFDSSLPGCVFTPGNPRYRSRDVDRMKIRDGTECSRHWERVVGEFEPDLTVAIFGGGARADVEVDGTWLEPCTPGYAEWYRRSFHEAVDVLAASGSRVVLTNAPLWSTAGLDSNPNFLASRNWVNDRVRCINDLTREVADDDPTLGYVDLDDFFCDNDGCAEKIDGVTLREDGVHFKDEAAGMLNDWLVPQLVRLVPPDASAGSEATSARAAVGDPPQ
ncbi:MAG: acyltransferase family protein [Acidimicrobiia bacterium]